MDSTPAFSLPGARSTPAIICGAKLSGVLLRDPLSRYCPSRRQHLCLLQHGRRGLVLLVRQVAVLAQIRLTSTRSWARTFSRSVDSMVTLLRTVATSSRATVSSMARIGKSESRRGRGPGFEIASGKSAQARERLGSRSKVQRFRVEARHRLLRRLHRGRTAAVRRGAPGRSGGSSSDSHVPASTCLR